jgi:hypothetical protein
MANGSCIEAGNEAAVPAVKEGDRLTMENLQEDCGNYGVIHLLINTGGRALALAGIYQVMNGDCQAE